MDITIGLKSLGVVLHNKVQFDVETVDLSGMEMFEDLQKRDARHIWPWHWAIVIGSKRINEVAHGLVVVECIANGCIRGNLHPGVYYPNADCGQKTVATQATVRMIDLLCQWQDSKRLERIVQSYNGIRVFNLHVAKSAETEGIRPTVEPF